MKLLMQPLSSINVRTEALLLTKVEVWWYLVVQLGPNLFPNFDQVRHDYFSLNHRKISLNCPSQYVAVRTRCRCLLGKNIVGWVNSLSLSRCPSLCSSAPLDLTPPQCQAPLLELSVKMVLLHLPHPRLVCLYTHLPPHRPVSVLQCVMH